MLSTLTQSSSHIRITTLSADVQLTDDTGDNSSLQLNDTVSFYIILFINISKHFMYIYRPFLV